MIVPFLARNFLKQSTFQQPSRFVSLARTLPGEAGVFFSGASMARPTLFDHPKFMRLAFILNLPRPYTLGLLEYLWKTGYASGNPVIGDEVDVEVVCEWTGERGILAAALLEVGFLDRLKSGKLQIHDLFDHAPEYVKSRLRMERFRKRNGSKLLRNGYASPAPAPAPAPSSLSTEKEESASRPRNEEGGSRGESSKNGEGKCALEKPGVAEVPVPPELDTPEFRAAWSDWLTHRRQIRKPLKPLAIVHKLRELIALGPTRATAAIRHSIGNGWQGIFEATEASAYGSNSSGMMGGKIVDMGARLEARRKAREQNQ